MFRHRFIFSSVYSFSNHIADLLSMQSQFLHEIVKRKSDKKEKIKNNIFNITFLMYQQHIVMTRAKHVYEIKIAEYLYN